MKKTNSNKHKHAFKPHQVKMGGGPGPARALSPPKRFKFPDFFEFFSNKRKLRI